MIVDIPKLRADGEWFEGEEPAAILGLEGESSVRAAQPLHYRFFIQPVSDRLVVRGTVSVSLEFQCGRCAEFFSTTVEESSFLQAYEISGATETVDVTPDIREEILLRLPHFPVCSPDCRGLCPRCGTNLNRGSCACRPPGDLRWNALDGVRLG